MSTSDRPWIVIGNPENRRVTGFVAALRALGQEPAAVVAWAELLHDPERLAAIPVERAFVRLDSAGESPEVQRGLLGLGGRPEVVPRHGELVAPRAQHTGFLRLLEAVQEVVARRPGWRLTAEPRAIARVFDKRRFHTESERAGVRVAPALAVDTVAELLEAMEQESGSVFVKLRTGSSASGLAVYRQRPRPVLMTTLRETPEGRFNSLRVNRVTDPVAIARILWFLVEEEGAHVERTVPKARLGGLQFDCRVVMVDHEPAFVVVRQSTHPITNLHLGGRRGRLDQLFDACPGPVWEAAMADCRTVSRRYGGLHLGVDVLFERRFTGHRIIEANAFGDLLPGITRSGWSVYETEILAAERWSAPDP